MFDAWRAGASVSIGPWAGVLAARGAIAGGATTDKWTGLGEAPLAFWIVVGLIVAALVGFMVWTRFSRRVPHSIGPGMLGALVGLFVVWTFFLYLVPAMTATTAPFTERTWNWQPGEVLQDPGGSDLEGEPYRGYQLYVAHACMACHTLYVRPQDLGTGWAEGVDGGDVARAEDYVRMPSPPLGTQRNGPDLSFIGRRIPDMGYQIDHLREPRRFKPDSVMPTYRHLSDRDLRDLAAFLVSLGNSKDDLRAGAVLPVATATEMSPSAQRRAELYRSVGCVACHSLDGRDNLGPTWKGLWGKEEELEGGGRVLVDREYLRESIVDPNAKIVKGYPAVMPPYTHLSEEDIEALIDFIQAL